MKKIGLYFVLLIIASGLLAGCVPTSPAPTETPEIPAVEMVTVTVYFFDQERFIVGTEPYEVGVPRQLHPDANLPYLTLQAYFDGPTEVEAAQGLYTLTNGCTGFSSLTVEDGIARVYLEGPCNSGGSAYTIATPIIKTLLQFEEISYVKLYDANGITEEPSGPSNSIPFILEP